MAKTKMPLATTWDRVLLEMSVMWVELMSVRTLEATLVRSTNLLVVQRTLLAVPVLVEDNKCSRETI